MPTNPRRSPSAGAQSVTRTRRSPDQDRARRMRQYLVAMGIRTVAFPLAVWAVVSGATTLGWVLFGLAALIPSVAVMAANAVDQRRAPTGEVASPVPALGPGPVPEAPADQPDAVILGTIVSSRHTVGERGTGRDADDEQPGRAAS